MKLQNVLLIFSVLVLFVVAGCSKPIAGQAIWSDSAKSCVGSDTKNDYAVKGTVKLSDGGLISDECYTFSNGKTYVFEKGCKAGKTTVIQKNCNEYPFNKDYSCVDGACVSSVPTKPVTCAGGTMCNGTSVNGAEGQIVCGTDLQSWKCINNNGVGQWLGQKDKCVCPKTCTDSDGGQNFTFVGKITANDVTKEDYCGYSEALHQNILIEGTCLNNNYLAVNKSCDYLGNGYECQSGRCGKFYDCIDTDINDSISLKGVVQIVELITGEIDDGPVNDMCYGNNVGETYCSWDPSNSNWHIKSKDITCPIGSTCKDGACVKV